MKEDTILKVLPWDVRSIIQKEKLEFEYLQEIRLREGKPLIFLYHDTEVIPGAKARRPYLVTKDNIREMLEYISNYSYMRASRRCGRDLSRSKEDTEWDCRDRLLWKMGR